MPLVFLSGLRSRYPLGLRPAAGALVVALSVLATTCKLQDLVRSKPLSVLGLAPTALVDSARAGSTAARVSRVALSIGSDAVPWTLRTARGSTWLRPLASPDDGG